MKHKNSILLAFGANIRTLRLKKGLTQRALAKRSGLDVTYCSGIERGCRNASLKSIESLAKGLGCSMAKTCQGLE
jgi:transcriptional regulator with XRE-family HTH domain